jgi:hypothetical protein
MDYFPAISNSGEASSSNEDQGNCMDLLLDKVKKTIHPQPPKARAKRNNSVSIPAKKKTEEKEEKEKEKEKEKLPSLLSSSSVSMTHVASLLEGSDASQASTGTPTNSRSSAEDCPNTIERCYKRLLDELEGHKKMVDFKLDQVCEDVRSVVTMVTQQAKDEYVKTTKESVERFCEDVREIERENAAKKRQKK